MDNRVIGVILSGGKSVRFQTPKAFAVYNSQYFYERALSVLSSYVHHPIIVSHESLRGRFPKHLSVIEDEGKVKGKGPLAGIYSAMKTVQASWYIVLPCDMPLLSEKVIEKLVELIETEREVDGIVPIIKGQIQPLVAAYHRRCLNEIEVLLEAETYAMKRLLDKITVKYVTEKDLGCNAEQFQNINTQKEYKEIGGYAGDKSI
ncbi:molybdenum cofactor guanylyltransferase [Bacillus taeanensis]|uniref:molybdenum cofactor guanylyltransferase n=1 Tax=Bacillus taeanensis TaxID=273032 RepID=UPI0015F078BD|nr:molybdenum cofactor guanylyltransferase [Bacillus taeanensis]